MRTIYLTGYVTKITCYYRQENLLSDTSREFFKTDKIPTMIIAGAHLEL